MKLLSAQQLSLALNTSVSIMFIVVLSMFFSFIPSSLSSQFVEINIYVNGGNSPETVSWRLFDDEANLKLADDNDKIVEDSTEYFWNFIGNFDDCYRFDISGLPEGGYYHLQVNNEWIVYEGVNLGSLISSYFGDCQYGSSCDNPEYFNLNSTYQVKLSTKEDHWYRFSPIEKTILNINTCYNEDDNEEFVDTKLWVYSSCDIDFSDGAEGAIIFNDESFLCEEASSISNFIMEADSEYFVRVGERDEAFDGILETIFIIVPDILGCIDSTSCNFNPFANLDDESCVSSLDSLCGPDLIVDSTTLENSAYLEIVNITDTCLVKESCTSGFGERELVRFSTSIINIGNADYIVGSPMDNPTGFSDDNCHMHWHQLSYAEYLVYSGEGELVPVGLKNGFCLLDIACPISGSNPKYNCGFMGISAGCIDVYSSDYDCQWIDVTNLEDGDYTLVVRINYDKLPDLRGMHELDYSNNSAQLCFNLDRTSGQLIFTKLEECATYVDCNGLENGDSTYDCNGDCDGMAHFGDINADNKLDSLDIESYFDYFKTEATYLNPCSDLDDNEELNVYDAALLMECLELNPSQETDPNHEHCLFPAGTNSAIDSFVFSLSNLDPLEKSFNLDFRNYNSELKALQLSFSGIKIDSVSWNAIVEEDYKAHSSHNVYFLTKNIGLGQNEDYENLATVFYSIQETDSICIDLVVDAVNYFYQRTTQYIEDACLFNPLMTTQQNEFYNTIIYPNPTSGLITIQNNGSVKMERIELFNLDGTRQDIKYDNTSSPTINLSHLSSGLYIMKCYYEDFGYQIHKVFINH